MVRMYLHGERAAVVYWAEESEAVSTKGKTEAQKRAQRRYMETVATIQVRTTPERRERIKAHAEAQGESVNAFINRAIDETIERETGAES